MAHNEIDKNIIFAQCYSKRVMRELALSYGVYVNYQELGDGYMEFVIPALDSLMKKSDLQPDDRIVGVAGDHRWQSGISNLTINTVKGFIKKFGDKNL